MKLASLFDGIGGALLCAKRCGIEAVWSSEIESFPQKVTQHHFPEVKPCGDITKINGAEVEPVDIIVGGSPCQDLSIAGQRKGMKHSDFGDEETTRSGLFMEQIRIVKEMRNATGTTYPRFMVWENVPGAFSSNGGDDFRAVLEETARVSDSTISIPRSPAGWANSGSILGDGFSISWRTIDAQYWGVPQRRRRIYLVADFRGQSAPEILFEREGVSGHTSESRTAKQELAGNTENRTGDSIICSATQQGGAERLNDLAPTLTASAGMAGNMGPWISKIPVKCFDMTHANDVIREAGTIVPTLQARMGTGGNQIPLLARMAAFGEYETDGTFSTIKSRDYKDATGLVIQKHIRRLTPLECCRLQGYPDWYMSVPSASDSAWYKGFGNSFAVPCAEFVIRGIKEALEKCN